MRASLVLVLVATLGAAAPSRPADLSSVRRDLRSLVGAQETFYSDHGTYSPDLAALKLTLSDSVTIKFAEFNKNAYAAVGTMKGVDGASCVLMIGRVNAIPKTAGGKAAEAEGAVMCD
jgi:hypothetical protein